MSAAQWLTVVATVSSGLLGLAMLLTVCRVIIGPTLADRILALDLLTVLALGFVGTLAISTGQLLYLDIAIGLALLGFLATIAFARYMLSRRHAPEPPA